LRCIDIDNLHRIEQVPDLLIRGQSISRTPMRAK
jgi:hypothetical protein